MSSCGEALVTEYGVRTLVCTQRVQVPRIVGSLAEHMEKKSLGLVKVSVSFPWLPSIHVGLQRLRAEGSEPELFRPAPTCTKRPMTVSTRVSWYILCVV